MFVCSCNAVTEEEIEKYLPFGLQYVTLITKAGTCCGMCVDYIEGMEKELYTPVAQVE